MFYEVRLIHEWRFDPELDKFQLTYSALPDSQSSFLADIIVGEGDQESQQPSENIDASEEQYEHFRDFYEQFQATVFQLIVTILPQIELGEIQDQEGEIEEYALSIVRSFNGIPVRYLYDGLYLWIWICRQEPANYQHDLQANN